MALKKKLIPKLKKTVVFVPREKMCRRADRGSRRFFLRSIPATTLPIDGTNNAAVSCPMDDNDRLGDCMEAMACHMDNIWTYGIGKPGWVESSFALQAIDAQYLKASGGDNGLDEPTLLDQCWKPGLAGVPDATYVDSLDIDVTNVPLAQYAIDQFFGVCLMWDVPDEFINQFDTGVVFDSPMRPDPANGHGTPLADIDGSGRYRLWTWGTWCWVSPAFVASVDPAAFVVFSARQFSKADGYDAKGRHIVDQAAKWVAAGGNPIPASVINSFPAPTPTPPPTPNPNPPPPVPVPPVPGPVGSLVLANDSPAGNYLVIPETPALAALRARLGLTWQQWLQLILTILQVIVPIINPPPPPPAAR